MEKTSFQNAESFLNAIIEQSPHSLSITDNKGTTIRMNQACRELLQGTDDEILGKYNIFEDNVILEQGFMPLVHRVYEKGERVHFTVQYDTAKVQSVSPKIKTMLIIEATISPVLDSNKQVTNAIIQHVDITERKQTEDALLKSKQFLQQVIDNAPFGAHFYQLQEDGKLILTARNKAADEILKMNHAPLLGKTIEEAFPGLVTSNIPSEYIRIAREGTQYSHEQIDYDNSGIRGAFEINAFQTAPNYMAVFFTDITKRKQTEEERNRLELQLAQSQKMESIGRLAGGVAHDFNNMLGVIIGHAELALSQVLPDTPLHADLEEVQKAARRSADLTRQLLAFARKQIINPLVLNLNDAVASMLKLLRRLIGEDIELIWIPEAEKQTVKIDPSQLDQILANLCVNSRDAISGGGKITIRTRNATVTKQECAGITNAVPGDFVLLTISDDGCGMTPEVLSNLFEPFFTTKEVGHGTGLGLATVYGIMIQNHGFIHAVSQPGRGSEFRIYLPLVDLKPTNKTSSHIDSVHHGLGKTVLLVEDEPALMNMAHIMLQRMGFTVLPLGSPAKALKKVKEYTGPIHLLITDVVMPGMNGRDLTKYILEIKPEIKSLYMSGYTADVIAHQGVLEDGVHFIQKPFSFKDFSKAIGATLGKT